MKAAEAYEQSYPSTALEYYYKARDALNYLVASAPLLPFPSVDGRLTSSHSAFDVPELL